MAFQPQLRVVSTSTAAQNCTTTPCHAAQIHHRILSQVKSILFNGPTSPGEAWIYEYAKCIRGDLDARNMKFQVSILQKGFEASSLVFPPAPGFLHDVCQLIAMLPLKVGTVIERKLVIDLLLEAARQCNMAWWDSTREVSAVVFGVVHACMIYRHLEAEKQGDAELGMIMGKMDLEADHIETVMQLAESLEEGLKL
ncbi:hypothetical protein P171DRAFT_481338 [Karstenula rhodostoma CBS 690.94]|uniref:Uncharacterized protein n=1 Tax=Karstenula rhodostoma CBS 690.94 TaxID=1392251 RepID=A0A9P4PSY7_9PLEO|nr:hypothetical protein P171DRAFT_481338 [Karstenula rhodostoma CBS 690.94]